MVSRGEKPLGWPGSEKLTPVHMIHANEWLTDRGFGKAPLVIAPEPEGGTSGLRTYSLEQLHGIAAGLELTEANEPDEQPHAGT